MQSKYFHHNSKPSERSSRTWRYSFILLNYSLYTGTLYIPHRQSYALSGISKATQSQFIAAPHTAESGLKLPLSSITSLCIRQNTINQAP